MNTKNNLFRKRCDGRRSFRNDERGVSAVIGVILMIAITVVIAAVIAAFAFGYAGKLSSAPSAQLTFTEEESSGKNYIKISHEGGDAFNMSSESIDVYLDGTEITVYSNSILGPGGVAYIFNNGNDTLSKTCGSVSANLTNSDDSELVVLIIDRDSTQTMAKHELTWT